MILLDFNGIALGTVNMNKNIDESLLRHQVLNIIRMYNVKYRKDFGQMVICCDHRSWRKDYYPEYKASRGTNREKSDIDWPQIFVWLNTLLDDIRANFPYKVVQVKNAEADDLIGVAVLETQEFGQHDEVMIVSADKDFIQLHQYSNVKQYSPIIKKLVRDPDPYKYIFEHILKGDSGDGVPNILSPDNSFTDKIRQTPMTKKKIAHFWENRKDLQSVMTESEYRNYQRNKKMIDLHDIPKELYTTIKESLETAKAAPKMKILNYLIKKRCKLLIECIEDFH